MYAKVKHSLHAWRTGAFALCAATCLTTPVMADPGEQHLVMNGAGVDYYANVKSQTFADRRFVETVHQKYDFSCGSAALATLLTYHYGHPIDEMEILNAMYVEGDQQKIKREGFSLLDMKNYLQAIGYRAEGYRESLDKLSTVGIPAIVLINRRGFLHFVVVKGVTKDEVSIGDPTLGVVLYDRAKFESMWNGILFVIVDNMNIGRKHFNTEVSWKPYGLPQFRNMLDTGALASVTLGTAFTPGYY